jgi:hypothetical protein
VTLQLKLTEGGSSVFGMDEAIVKYNRALQLKNEARLWPGIIGKLTPTHCKAKIGLTTLETSKLTKVYHSHALMPIASCSNVLLHMVEENHMQHLNHAFTRSICAASFLLGLSYKARISPTMILCSLDQGQIVSDEPSVY